MLCHYAECRILIIRMLNVIKLSVAMLNVVMLSVVAPTKEPRKVQLRQQGLKVLDDLSNCILRFCQQTSRM
jgi:hypothetical protein